MVISFARYNCLARGEKKSTDPIIQNLLTFSIIYAIRVFGFRPLHSRQRERIHEVSRLREQRDNAEYANSRYGIVFYVIVLIRRLFANAGITEQDAPAISSG